MPCPNCDCSPCICALFAGSKPRQVLYGMHPERGRTWQYAMDLSNGDTHECRFSR